jgi:putative endopeptidase
MADEEAALVGQEDDDGAFSSGPADFSSFDEEGKPSAMQRLSDYLSACTRRELMMLIGMLLLALLNVIFVLMLLFHPPVKISAGPHDWRALAATVNAVRDPSLNPCSDFYQYSCGGWIKSTNLSSDRSSYVRSFSGIADQNLETLVRIIGEDWPLLGPWYDLCMNTTAMNQKGYAPLLAWQARIAQSTNVSSIMSLVAALHRQEVSALFSFYVESSLLDPNVTFATLDQGGLSLPVEYYVSHDNMSANALAALSSYVQTAFQLIGQNGAQAAADVLQVERALSAASQSSVERRDPYAVFHPIGAAGLQNLTPGLDWSAYWSRLRTAPVGSNLNVPNLGYMVALQQDLSNATQALPGAPFTLSALQNYLLWRVITAHSAFLTDDLRSAAFNFSSALSGAKTPPPRERQCALDASNYLSDLMGRFYVQTAFNGDSKQLALALLQQIRTSVQSSIETVPWMDAATRTRGLDKLAAISPMIGYPDSWEDYRDLQLQPGDYYRTVENWREWAFQEEVNKIGVPVDKTQWQMTPFEVNAYYDPLWNQIVFPAGIMQGAFFNRTWPDFVNLAGIGMVMGHEITHGFDDQGSQFDKTGRLLDWWSPETKAAFQERTACVVNQYSAYNPGGGMPNVNGNLTLGENIADNGGLRAAYAAFARQNVTQKDRDEILQVFGMSPEQLFFLSFGQSWCSIYTPANLHMRLLVDPHSPNMFRVNGPVSNMPEFAQAFNCPAGSPMNPTTKCSVW